MKTTLTVMMIGLVMMLGGCSQNQWAKPGSTEQQFDTDHHACIKMLMRRYGPMAVSSVPTLGQENIAQCLRDYGYRDIAVQQMQNDPRAHLTPEEITRFGAEINTPTLPRAPRTSATNQER